MLPNLQVPVVVEQDADGFHVSCPSIRGCRTHGATYQQALENIQDAIRANLDLMRERGESFTLSPTSIAVVDVAV